MRTVYLPVLAGMMAFGPFGCGGGGKNKDQPFGATAVVVLVNPAVNDANTVAVPAPHDPQRVEGVRVDADPGDADTSDERGIAVLGKLDPGDLDLVFDGDASLPVTIASEGDVLDLAVGYDGEAVEAFANFPIRYAVGGEIQQFDTKTDPGAISDALADNGNIVFFDHGRYQGDLLITGDDVILFGRDLEEPSVVIDGSVEVRGTAVRLRGVVITGDLNVMGNGFGMAFSVVQGSAQVPGQGVALMANQFCGQTTVPSSAATMLANLGLAPLDPPPEAVCQQ